MRTSKTLIFLILLGTITILGARVSSWVKTFYWSQKVDQNLSQHARFLGEWIGENGTRITIRPGGKGDFHSDHYYVQDANVIIQDDRIYFNFPGFEKIFLIEQPPRLGNDGLWRMRLNGEMFFKHSVELLVRSRIRASPFNNLSAKEISSISYN